jgi:hypothetical protein
MGFRFQKRVSILPGLWLNFSKSGVSVSVGRKNATINIGQNGVTGSTSIPGTGIGYREKLFGGRRREKVRVAIRDASGNRLATVTPATLDKHIERLEAQHGRVFATFEGGDDDGAEVYATPV